MKSYLLVLMTVSLCCTAATAQRKSAGLPSVYVLDQSENAIRAVLEAQVKAWNAGDIAGYMAAGYWQNDSLVFIGRNGPQYGYESTLANYRKSYPDAAAMGQLSFELRSLQPLSADYYFAIGKWSLKRGSGDAGGSWTLLFRKISGKWRIVVDHSS